MSVEFQFQALVEDTPNEKWKAIFQQLWPGYRAWFLRSGVTGRPTYLECRQALRTYMPELVPLWEQLIELTGGGDVESRFLSLWCPPPYIAGCSQGVWFDPKGQEEPILLRNYDFAPVLLEGNLLNTRWLDQRVIAMSDCLWGALDGVNEAGLSASLSFGGRTVTGTGFGIPLVLRYILELAHTTQDAVNILKRIPVHMTYSVTLLDRKGEWNTVFVSPDRQPEVVKRHAVTNYQNAIEWPQHATATHSAERLTFLEQVLHHATNSHEVLQGLLTKPLYQDAWLRGYGTLYSAIYRPLSQKVEICWPHDYSQQSFEHFTEEQKLILLSVEPAPIPPAPLPL
ncbi:C45 family autoproteolytic acyltransferase/hydolase [Acinetobacter baylyi]|uniref:Peptidase C45 hydrolase domain-containing protein n=1 Tax=Acinetobacter baylyi (strain ATCC 33305 / BD413 / ADP1) TaxID=62977 RepID=Q6F7F3_ACIAD|nr:C45 family peptidase [Acinetobacter baylyi]ENV55013.1 hypothetical protein F952_00735 [Acinetobacter baylyi DSM 14961 = CIP 107474]KAF2371158.1 hypothetical protein BSL88_07955 [Acinetobacter baylyi]KAF2374633.1 hypothetical protein BSL67_04830 [Acinetobacter baylyi]KAF2377558.1 hypothetical protein BSN81_07440 [Acinetobacter baylyi]KAF2381766.1 hypothetical protein BSN83_04670 [Acinetobacter baylyi]